MSNEIPDGMDEISKRSNAAARKYADSTEHIALNATEADAETIIKNMRFMAYGIGWDDGFREAILDVASGKIRKPLMFEELLNKYGLPTPNTGGILLDLAIFAIERLTSHRDACEVFLMAEDLIDEFRKHQAELSKMDIEGML